MAPVAAARLTFVAPAVEAVPAQNGRENLGFAMVGAGVQVTDGLGRPSDREVLGRRGSVLLTRIAGLGRAGGR